MANTKCEVSLIGRLGQDAEIKTLDSGCLLYTSDAADE